MAQLPPPLDTSPEVERLQTERWRQMMSAEKADLVMAVTVAAIEMTKSDIRHRT